METTVLIEIAILIVQVTEMQANKLLTHISTPTSRAHEIDYNHINAYLYIIMAVARTRIHQMVGSIKCSLTVLAIKSWTVAQTHTHAHQMNLISKLDYPLIVRIQCALGILLTHSTHFIFLLMHAFVVRSSYALRTTRKTTTEPIIRWKTNNTTDDHARAFISARYAFSFGWPRTQSLIGEIKQFVLTWIAPYNISVSISGVSERTERMHFVLFICRKSS